MSEDQTDQPADIRPINNGRRTFCKACIAGMGAASASMVGFPIISFMARPQTLDLNKPLEIPLERLSPGQAQYVEYRGQQVIALMTASGPLVFSASCPHLGCNVIWDSGDSMFRCPCHGAFFNATGEVVRGPVSGSLRKIPFEVKDGKVIVSSEV
jgi:cytochrome b6-f complex iron-sulfur subunit